MEIKVVVKHGQIPGDVQQLMEEKVRRLPRFFERITSIMVLVDLGHIQAPKVEIRVSAEEREDFFAVEEGPTVMAAFDVVLERVERQLRKHKEKIIHRRGREDRFSGELPN